MFTLLRRINPERIHHYWKIASTGDYKTIKELTEEDTRDVHQQVVMIRRLITTGQIYCRHLSPEEEGAKLERDAEKLLRPPQQEQEEIDQEDYQTQTQVAKE